MYLTLKATSFENMIFQPFNKGLHTLASKIYYVTPKYKY